MTAIVIGAIATGALSLVAALRRRWIIITVIGHSMAPTFRDGQKLIARRVGRSAPVSRSDIVVFRLSGALARQLGSEDLPLRVKRVAAIEGDPVPEWFPSATRSAAGARVPRGKLLVAGDNPRSQGSRQLGYIDARDVVAVIRTSPAGSPSAPSPAWP